MITNNLFLVFIIFFLHTKLGTKVTDETIRQFIQHLPFVESIDLSECSLITDAGIAALSISKSDRLIKLNVSRCSRITDASLKLLKSCKALIQLDMRECELISLGACERFENEDMMKIGGNGVRRNVAAITASSKEENESKKKSIPSTTSLVSHKKMIINSCKGDWHMTQEKYFERKPREDV